jgi:cytochrome c oxidase subunit IV
MSHDHTPHIEGEYIPETYIPVADNHGTKALWKTFIYLTVITIVDFVLYFALPHGLGKNVLFIGLGLVKVVLIVGTFMHLKYEKINLILTIIIPVVFIVWFIIWMLYEGHALSTY